MHFHSYISASLAIYISYEIAFKMGNNKFDYILLEFIEIPYILICSETSLQSMTNCFSLNWISKVDIRADCFSIYTVFKVQYCKSKLIDYGCPIRFSFYKHDYALIGHLFYKMIIFLCILKDFTSSNARN